MKTLTKGNVIVEEIKVGDIHYEYEYGNGIKCEVITLPVRNSQNKWIWKSKNLTTGKEIDYMVSPDHPSHYSVNLYDYEAYTVKRYI